MGDFNRSILENMGISKQDADSRERSRQESAFKFGGEGIDRMITMQERTISNFQGAELSAEQERNREADQARAGREEFNVEYEVDPVEELARHRGGKSSQAEKSTDDGLSM